MTGRRIAGYGYGKRRDGLPIIGAASNAGVAEFGGARVLWASEFDRVSGAAGCRIWVMRATWRIAGRGYDKRCTESRAKRDNAKGAAELE